MRVFPFHLPHCKVLGSPYHPRFMFKVVLQISKCSRKLTRAQLVVTSAHFLWIYDYLLTLGDEVWYPCASLPANDMS